MAKKQRDNIIVTLDTETIGLDGAIKRIAIYHELTPEPIYGYSFEDIEPQLIWLYDMGFNVHVYIHNLEFDARKMPKIFERGNVLWSQCRIINGRYTKIVCKKYQFHDSFRILPESLASLSQSFDLEHGKLDLWEEVKKTYPGQYKDHIDFLSRCDPDDPLYMKYLGYDVLSLHELLYKLMDVSGLDVDEFIKIGTTASLSRYLFKNGYKGQKFEDENGVSDFDRLTKCKAWGSLKYIKGNHSLNEISYQEVEEKIRAGYYGGRTEVFKPLAEKAFHYDVNSEYPAVMLNNEYPVGYPDYYAGNYQCKYQFNKWRRNHKGLGFLKCKVFVPYQHIPPLPVKIQKLVFPCGYIEGTWTYSELEYAINNCGVEILEYEELIHFKQTYPIFHRFISVFSEIKSEAKANGEKALEKLAKLVQNTGYGYTGMRRDDKTELKDEKDLEKFEDRLIYHSEELGFIEIESIVHAPYIQVQVAAYVTSYARLLLLDALRIQSAAGEVYYCDTDSIVCSAPMSPEKVHKTKLGFWDLEKEIDSGIFLQPKVYYEHAEKETIKFKGVSRETAKGFNENFYKEIFDKLKSGQGGKIMVEHGKELLRSIKYGQKKGIDLNKLEIRDKELNLDNKQKRQMFYNENRTEPWYFGSLEQFRDFHFNIDYKPYLNEQGFLLDPIAGGM